MKGSPRTLGLFCILLMLLMPALHAAEDEDARRLYGRGQKLAAEGETDEALERFQTVATKYRRSEWCALALWEVYRIQDLAGDAEAAFAALDRLVTEQPGHFEKAHAAQFLLVKRLLGMGKEERRSLEPVRRALVTDPEVLAEMLRAIIKNGPRSEVGIQAQYCLGLALEKAGEKKEAVAAHEDFVENHPDHELADDASYQVACIAYKEWKAMRSMGSHQRNAVAMALTWFLSRFPESDKGAQARSCLAEVRASEQRELMDLARYYETRGNEKAAKIYYQQLALKFPGLLRQDGALRDKMVKSME